MHSKDQIGEQWPWWPLLARHGFVDQWWPCAKTSCWWWGRNSIHGRQALHGCDCVDCTVFVQVEFPTCMIFHMFAWKPLLSLGLLVIVPQSNPWTTMLLSSACEQEALMVPGGLCPTTFNQVHVLHVSKVWGHPRIAVVDEELVMLVWKNRSHWRC